MGEPLEKLSVLNDSLHSEVKETKKSKKKRKSNS